MLSDQIRQLQETGLAMTKKAAACTKASDAQTFIELGLKCMAEARTIIDRRRRNSVLLWFELCLAADVLTDYEAYLEFCARNAFEIMAEGDYAAQIGGLIGAAADQKATGRLQPGRRTKLLPPGGGGTGE